MSVVATLSDMLPGRIAAPVVTMTLSVSVELQGEHTPARAVAIAESVVREAIARSPLCTFEEVLGSEVY